MARTHELKTISIYWDAVAAGEKLFEVRKNDRFYQHGDRVILERLADNSARYYDLNDDGSTKKIERIVGPVLQGGQFGIEPGYCVFSLLPCPASADGARDE